MDQLVYHRIRSLELDIHIDKDNWNPVDGNWYVFHGGTLGSDETSCHRLTDCFDEIAAWHAAFPQHEVLTLWIDLKNDWAANHQPADLDALLTGAFGNALLTPGDLMTACPAATDLRDAVSGACSWPALEELRGRILVNLTGGGACTAGGKLNTYTDDAGDVSARAGFIAPDVNLLCPFAAYAGRDYVVVGNMNFVDRGEAVAIRNAGLIGRVWGDELNTEIGWDAAVGAGVHHLGTDKANFHQDSWSRSHNARGWPFTCFNTSDCGGTEEEAGQTLGIEVASEDIWNNSDDFVFAYLSSGTLNRSWRTMVSTPNSHVDPFGKGCLMARSNTGADAPYFAVCRPADANRLRIQVRLTTGASSSESQVDIVPADTVDQESLSWIRLDVTADGTCAEGFGSLDGSTWVSIGSQCFNTALVQQGVAANSHGAPGMKLLFSNLSRGGIARDAADLTFSEIGTVYAATMFDGAFGP